MECLFCKIVAGEVPSNKVFENENLYAFHDINPQAKVHVLIIPKMHFADAQAVDENNAQLVKEIFLIIPQLAKELGLCEDGYRVITNVGEHGQQSINHMHFHLIGGQQLIWKMID